MRTSTNSWTRASCKWLASACILLLVGCSHVGGNALPPLHEYSPAWQKQLKVELQQTLPGHPHLQEFVKDSVKLRQKVKEGHRIQKKTPFRLFKRRIDTEAK